MRGPASLRALLERPVEDHRRGVGGWGASCGDRGTLGGTSTEDREVVAGLHPAVRPPRRSSIVGDHLLAVAWILRSIDRSVIPKVNVGMGEGVRAAIEGALAEDDAIDVWQRDSVEIEAIDQSAAVSAPNVVRPRDVAPAHRRRIAPVGVVRSIERAVDRMRIERSHLVHLYASQGESTDRLADDACAAAVANEVHRSIAEQMNGPHGADFVAWIAKHGTERIPRRLRIAPVWAGDRRRLRHPVEDQHDVLIGAVSARLGHLRPNAGVAGVAIHGAHAAAALDDRAGHALDPDALTPCRVTVGDDRRRWLTADRDRAARRR